MIKMWGLLLTVIIFYFCLNLRNVKYVGKLPSVMTTGIAVIFILKFFGLDYISYNESASYITLMLGPATIALAYPLVENIELLTKNKRATYFGLLTAVITAIASVWGLGKLTHTDSSIIISMIPKSVTTPVAVEISKAIGGIPELTACFVAITGVYGAIIGHKILKLMHIKSDIAKGIAIGATSHVVGTSSCIEKKRPKQVVTSTLALIITGIITAAICVVLFK